MNRLPKYKAWDTNRKQYVKFGKGFTCNGVGQHLNFQYITEGNNTVVVLPSKHYYGQDFEIIWLQFTGIVDNNGIEIYEGDIIENKVGERFSICFDNGCFFIHPIWEENDYKDIPLYMVKLPFGKVVSNIFEQQLIKI